jgi:Polyketide cyclase / dehydrase and lipid transport
MEAMTATVDFELTRIVKVTPQRAWQCLNDWEHHGDWIPFTRVEVDAVDNDRFTAWSGIGRLALEDRMHVVERETDTDRFRARVDKLGPVLFGDAEFVVSAGLTPDSAVVHWRETVRVTHLPPVLAPIAAYVGKHLFSLALGRMGRAASR